MLVAGKLLDGFPSDGKTIANARAIMVPFIRKFAPGLLGVNT